MSDRRKRARRPAGQRLTAIGEGLASPRAPGPREGNAIVTKPALILVHALAPPVRGGTPIVLHRLLSGMDGYRLEVFTSIARRAAVRRRDGLLLEGRYRYFLKLPSRATGFAGVGRLATAIDTALAVVAGLRALLAARAPETRLVMSVADDGFSLIAGAVCACLARQPHVVMVFDLWEENAYGPGVRRRARRFEGAILTRAAAVVVYCDAMARHYEVKHGIRCYAIPTPIVPLLADATATSPSRREEHEVLVAGAIYWAQEDAVRRLLEARSQLERVRVTILGEERNLRSRNLVPDRVESPLAGDLFKRRLKQADVLFLGLSFNSPHPDVIRTATPARLPEFLASGTPVLVHAPPEAHVSEYVRGLELAELADEPNSSALAAALARILADPAASTARAKRARKLVRERHDIEAVRQRFTTVLDEVSNEHRARDPRQNDLTAQHDPET